MLSNNINERAEDLFDPDLCRQCGGLCCQGHTGIYADPARFVRTFFPQGLPSKLPKAEELALLGIDLKRFAGVDIPAPRLAPWGCVFLGREGCRLSAEERPCECLLLQPSLETLLEGEIHCKTKPGFSYRETQKKWKIFWESFQ